MKDILKPLSQYIDDLIINDDTSKTNSEMLGLIINRNEEGKTPLGLGQFIPCDKNGKPLEKPDMGKYGWIDNNTFDSEGSKWALEGVEEAYYEALEEYQQAEAKVLFEGLCVDKWETLDGSVWLAVSTEKFPDGDCILIIKNGEINWQKNYKTIESIAHLNLPLTKAGSDLINNV